MMPVMTTIVLLPGMDGTGTLYSGLAKAMAGKCKLIVATYPVDRALDYAALEVFVRNQLPDHEDYVLLGESFSGPIAISIASNRPARLKGLVLCATFASNPYPVLSNFRCMVPYLSLSLAPLPLLGYLLLGSFSTKELYADLTHALASVRPLVLKARLCAILSCDVREKLLAITVPVLYLRATKDRLVSASSWIQISKHLPSLQLAEFDAPHFLLQTKPDEVVKQVLHYFG